MLLLVSYTGWLKVGQLALFQIKESDIIGPDGLQIVMKCHILHPDSSIQAADDIASGNVYGVGLDLYCISLSAFVAILVARLLVARSEADPHNNIFISLLRFGREDILPVLYIYLLQKISGWYGE